MRAAAGCLVQKRLTSRPLSRAAQYRPPFLPTCMSTLSRLVEAKDCWMERICGGARRHAGHTRSCVSVSHAHVPCTKPTGMQMLQPKPRAWSHPAPCHVRACHVSSRDLRTVPIHGKMSVRFCVDMTAITTGSPPGGPLYHCPKSRRMDARNACDREQPKRHAVVKWHGAAAARVGETLPVARQGWLLAGKWQRHVRQPDLELVAVRIRGVLVPRV
jgi:hypothetical protein